MDAPALYNLSPLAEVLLTGLLLACGPLFWVWLRHRRSSPVGRRQALTLVTLFLTFDLVLFGAFTRLTDSGLGCPDWPGCYGQASPIGAQVQIAAAHQDMPTGPVSHGKAWVEMVHRYLATAVGGLIVVGLVWSVALRWRHGLNRAEAGDGVLWPALTLVWVCLQGAFGALTVTMKLFPAIVTLHLAGGVVLLLLLGLQVQRQSTARGAVELPRAWRRLLLAGALLLALQILLGGWVSTNYAVLACSSFPTCQGQWWPDMNFAQGFELWRPLGLQAQGEPISFAALTAIHYVHRLVAGAVFLVLGCLAWRLSAVERLRRLAAWLAALLGLQLLTGLSNVVLGWPLVAALAHTGGAAGLALVMGCLVAASRASPGGSSSVSVSASRFSA
ncbi:MAG: COX15/CtaA family protein [Curvibacter sp.]|nr:COX15/CtaA family protein [Curvibacter sp.]